MEVGIQEVSVDLRIEEAASQVPGEVDIAGGLCLNDFDLGILPLHGNDAGWAEA